MNEHEICKLWEENNIFSKTLEKNKDKEEYVFFDGPPFMSGSVHFGHVAISYLKDSILRHHHNDKHVPRNMGADTHGLPIEYEIEKLLGIKTTDEILKYGIGNYNEECRSIVLRCEGEWSSTFNRIGRWVDFDKNYKTMSKEYMNSVFWTFKQLYDKGRVYEGSKIMPYSTKCGTCLSNFEKSQNEKMIRDDALYVKMPLVEKFFD